MWKFKPKTQAADINHEKLFKMANLHYDPDAQAHIDHILSMIDLPEIKGPVWSGFTDTQVITKKDCIEKVRQHDDEETRMVFRIPDGTEL